MLKKIWRLERAAERGGRGPSPTYSTQGGDRERGELVGREEEREKDE